MSDYPAQSALKNGLILATIALVSDQITKLWAVDAFGDGSPFVAVTGFFNLVLTFNRGVSFSMFSTSAEYGPYIFAALNVAVSVFLFLWMRKAENRHTALALGAMIGGALGNAIDRFLWGGVVDFLDFHWQGHHWPAFNLADSFIVCAVGVLLFDSLFLQPKKDTKGDV